MIRVAKILVITIALLLIASIAAMYFGVINPPQIIKDIPYLGKLLTSGEKETEDIDPELMEIEQLKLELEDTNTTIERLENEKAELEQQLIATEKERDELRASKEESDTKNGQLQQLAEYYSKMKVKQAAAIMAELDDDTVVGILTNMGTETAASIIGGLDPQRAAVLTKKILQVKGGE